MRGRKYGVYEKFIGSEEGIYENMSPIGRSTKNNVTIKSLMISTRKRQYLGRSVLSDGGRQKFPMGGGVSDPPSDNKCQIPKSDMLNVTSVISE